VRPMRHYGGLFINKSVRHARGKQQVLTHVIEIFLAGGALNHAARDGVSVCAVAELRSGLEEQRISGEDREAVAHAVVVLRAFNLALLVMTDAGGVGEELASRDGPLL